MNNFRFWILDFRLGIQNPKSKIKNSCGFTLIELVFVAIVMGMLMASTAPQMRRHWTRLQAEQAAFHVAQTLRTARALAVAQGQTVVWRLDASLHRVTLGMQADDGAIGPIGGRVGQGRVVADPIRVSVECDRETEDRVRFFPDGTSEAAMVLISEAAVARYQIAINDTTGHVTLQPARISAH